MLLFFLTAWIMAAPAGKAATAQKPETRSVDGLIHDLKHPDAPRRLEAARLLGMNRVRTAVPALIEASEDPDKEVRYAAVRALRQIGDTRALGTFIQRTRDGETRIQREAVDGIIDIYVVEQGGFVTGLKKVVTFLNPLSSDYDSRVVEPYVPVSQEAINALIDLLFVSDTGLRENAARGLGILRAGGALRAIEDALNRETSNSVKVELIRAIYKIGDPEGGEAVVPFIRDPDKRTHDEAILTAGRLRVKSAVGILDDLYRIGVEERRKIFGLVPVSGTDDLQRKVLEALSYIGDPSSKDIFEDALSDSRDHYRRYSAEGLGRIGDPSYTRLLAERYLRETSGSVRLALSYALFLLGREEHLVELVDRVLDDQAYYYLLELSPEKTALLYPHVKSEKEAVAARLLEVIGLRGDRSALPLAQEMSGSPSAEVASSANLAIRRLQARFP
jgi:HEAT repeat protein